MTKRRMIHSCIWQSEHFADLTMQQRLLWIGLITNADDQGRGRAHPGLVRAAVFPFDVIKQDDIAADIEMLRDAGLLLLYQADEKMYYQVIKWWEYQTPQWAYPSEHPAPDGWPDRLRFRKDNSIVTDNWKPETLPKALPKETGKPLVYARNDNDKDKDKDKEGKPQSPPAKPKRAAKPKAPTPKAVLVFRDNAHRFPNKSLYQDIADAVGDDPQRLKLWGSVVKGYIAMGWNPVNIAVMLEFFGRGEVPAPKGNGSAPQYATPVPEGMYRDPDDEFAIQGAIQ